ncbi:MAG: HK97 family phage prohead protease [Rhodothalassiaceae bacterium]
MSDTMDAAFEIKRLDGTEGVFEGYASVFEQVDDGRDAVLPGAFARSLAEKGAPAIKLLWQHDPKEPIGIVESLREDARGLFVKGRLLLDLQRAREALSLMRSGALDGLSIGYRAAKARHDRARGVRLLEDIDLWEISLVTFPMQRAARIAAFKAAAPQSIRDFESFLREAGGFSRREAKALAAHGFKALGRCDAGADWASTLQAIDALRARIEETLS